MTKSVYVTKLTRQLNTVIQFIFVYSERLALLPCSLVHFALCSLFADLSKSSSSENWPENFTEFRLWRLELETTCSSIMIKWEATSAYRWQALTWRVVGPTRRSENGGCSPGETGSVVMEGLCCPHRRGSSTLQLSSS